MSSPLKKRFIKPKIQISKKPQIKVPDTSAHIVLNMIVKNESDIMERCLRSLPTGLIDSYVIYDTGSDDGTPELIEKVASELGLPGRVIRGEWKNFGWARNEAINHARKWVSENGLNPETAYGYWQDADELTFIDPEKHKPVEWLKRVLTNYDSAMVQVTYGSQNYQRLQFFKLNPDTGYYWWGHLHEVLTTKKEGVKMTELPIGLLVKPDGNSWKTQSQQEKYESHAKLLEKYIEEDKDPRWIFYLAQSYRDAGTEENIRKSIYWYDQRSKMQNGYWEEVWFSKYMVAQLSTMLPENQGLKYENIIRFIECGRYNRYRIEHLVPVVLFYQNIQDWETSYIFAKHMLSMGLQQPIYSRLFVDTGLYDWRAIDLFIISAWYSGRIDEAKRAYIELTKRKKVIPENDWKRIEKNGQFFKS